MRSRVLVACHKRAIETSVSEKLSDPAYGFQVESEAISAETLSRVSAGDYSAIVCCVESPEGLGEVAQFRQASPDLPIVLVSSVTDPAFGAKARLAGATSIVPSPRELTVVAEFLSRTLKLMEASRTMAERVRQARELAQDLHRMVQERQAQRDALLQARAYRKSRLLPLLVGDDPEHAFLMVRAFEKAEIFAPLPILRSGEEVASYLNGAGAYSDRNRYPLPNIILLDLRLPAMSGLEVLSWIRDQPRFSRIPVIVMSDGVDPDTLRRAYGLQANSYLLKPGSFDDLVEMVRAIDLYWSSINIGRDLF